MAQRTRILVLVLVLLGAVAAGLYYSGLLETGRTSVPINQPTATKEPAKAKTPPPPPPVKLEAPAKPLPTEPGPTPVTLTSLRLMPEKTQFALGIPPLSVMLAKTIPIVQEVFKQDLNVQEELDSLVHDLVGEAGIAYEGGTTEALKALGVNPDESGAVFMNFSAFSEMAAKALEETAAGKIPEEPEFNPKDAKVVATLPLLDAAKAEDLLKTELGSVPELGLPATQDAGGGITMNVYEGPVTVAYFISNNRLVIGTDLDMMKSAAAHMTQPVTFRYGTAACPADDADELVAMVYGRDFIPVLKQLLDTAAELQPAAVAMAQSQFAVLEKMFSSETTDDPMLMTLSVLEDRVELRSRVDTATHAGLLDYIGLAEPLRLAPMLPEDTMAFLSYRLNEQTKHMLAESAKSAVPPDNSKAQQISTYVNQGLSLLGDEITLGVGGLNDLNFPSVYLMVATSNPATAQLLIGFAGPQQKEVYNEVPISQVTAVPFPIPLYVTFAGNALVLSNNIAGMKGLIDRAKAKEITNLFASEQPPLDPTTPYYSLLLVRTALYSEVLRPVLQSMMPAGMVPEHLDGALVELNSIIRDLRVMAQLDGSWYDARIMLSLAQKGAAEAAPSAAPAPAPEAAPEKAPEKEAAPAPPAETGK